MLKVLVMKRWVGGLMELKRVGDARKRVGRDPGQFSPDKPATTTTIDSEQALLEPPTDRCAMDQSAAEVIYYSYREQSRKSGLCSGFTLTHGGIFIQRSIGLDRLRGESAPKLNGQQD
jgi:hypothetical protein